MSQQHVLLMGQDTKPTGPVMLTWLKLHGEPAREPTKPITFTDAIKALLRRGYAVAERNQADQGVHQMRLTFTSAC